MLRTNKWILLLMASMVLGYGCSSKDNAVATNINAQRQADYVNAVFSGDTGEIVVRVYYEVGAEPYTGAIGATANDTWDITKQSIQALFQNHVGRLIHVPSGLGQMTALPDLRRNIWTHETLLELAKANSPTSTPTSVAVGVYFLNGTFNGDDTILGLQITGYPYAFVFKDVVGTAAAGNAIRQRYIEQATVVHEIGHAFGLVNNGLPMAALHEDASHPKHSNNVSCVMHHSIGSRLNVLTFILNAIAAQRLNLFGPESLDDARSYHPTEPP